MADPNVEIKRLAGRPDLPNADLNNLNYWYPRIKGLVPVPKTLIIRTGLDLLPLVDDMPVPGFDSFVAELVAAGDTLGWPCFMRTGYGSGKHEWESTCCVSGPRAVPAHVRALVEWSEMADFFGLPYSTWAVREMLKTEPAFYAFWGKMPITKERRYFVENEKVLGFHPYWPPDAFSDERDEPGWRAKLDALNVMPEDEVRLLTSLSEKVSGAVPGAWSIDWLCTADHEWFLIDMAMASESFCWREYPNAPTVDFGIGERQTAIDKIFHQEAADPGSPEPEKNN